LRAGDSAARTYPFGGGPVGGENFRGTFVLFFSFIGVRRRTPVGAVNETDIAVPAPGPPLTLSDRKFRNGGGAYLLPRNNIRRARHT